MFNCSTQIEEEGGEGEGRVSRWTSTAGGGHGSKSNSRQPPNKVKHVLVKFMSFEVGVLFTVPNKCKIYLVAPLVTDPKSANSLVDMYILSKCKLPCFNLLFKGKLSRF